MILLKSTDETLEVVTSSTAGIDFSVSFVDVTTTTFSPSTSEDKITTATTTTILAAPAASTQRQVKLITIRNIHASDSNTISVCKDIAGTKYKLTPEIILLAGECLLYVDSDGWIYYSATGQVKAAAGATAWGSVTGTLSNQTDLQDELDLKAPTAHSHPQSDVTDLVTDLGLKKTDSMATDKLLGRGTAATGVIEEITLGTGLSFTGTTLNAAAGAGDALVANPLSQFAATTSLQLIGVISDEEGTGNLVFNTSPTFVTQITAPIVIGGTGTTQTLIYRTTSGVGATGARHIFQVGNNGATEAMTVLNDGNVGIGTAAPTMGLQINRSDSPSLSGTSPTGAFGIRSNTSMTMGVESGSPYGGWIQIRHSTAAGSAYPLLLNPLGGNVGIGDNGTFTPAASLHLRGLQPETAGIRFTALNNSSQTYQVSTGITGVMHTGFSIHDVTNAVTRFHLTDTGRIGIGTTSPTAVLHLKASTATANTASLKIDAGTVADTAVSGNIESDGTNLYWTDSGGTRRQLNN